MSQAPTVVLRVVQAPEGSAVTVGWSIPLTQAASVLGRSPDADIVLADRTVSRHHARIAVTGSRVEVSALTASNGTFLEGERVPLETPAPVPERGARLQLGGVVLDVVRLLDTTPVLEQLGAVAPRGDALLHVIWDAGQCMIRAGGRDLGLTGVRARLLGVLALRAGEVVHHWDLEQELATRYLAPLATAVRRALVEAIEAGSLDGEALRQRLVDVDPLEEGAEAQDLVRHLLQSRRGHGYMLHLSPDDVSIVRV